MTDSELEKIQARLQEANLLKQEIKYLELMISQLRKDQSCICYLTGQQDYDRYYQFPGDLSDDLKDYALAAINVKLAKLRAKYEKL